MPTVFRRGMRVLATAISEEPRAFTIAVTSSALFGAMTIGMATVMGRITERVILPSFRDGHAATGALATGALAILGVALLKIVGIVGRRLGAGIMQYRLEATYRRRVTRQYLRLPMSWHHRHPTGELLSNANSDVEAMWWPIAPMPFACGTLVMLVTAGVVLVLIDPLLAVIGLVVFPGVLVANSVYSRAMAPRITRAQELRADVSEVAHESIDGALVVKTLGGEERETERFRVRAEELRDSLVDVGRIRGVFDPIIEALPNLGTLSVLLVGGFRLRSGEVTVSDLVTISYMFTVLALPVRAIGWVLGDLPRAAVGFERVGRVLAEKAEQPHGQTDLPSTASPASLACERVTFRYGSTAHAGLREPAAPDPGPVPEGPVALTDVTFDVGPGRTIAVTGPTGSGKSTLVSLLVRLADPETGTVLLDRVDVRDLRRGGVARHAAMVGQSTFLFDDTVRGNIALGQDVDDDAVWRALALAQADGFIRGLPGGLDTRIGERGTSLSGGQRQRLALARALVRRPRLLILDDATSSVDPAVEQAILGGLRDADLAATVVVVAYRRASIAMADEVVYIENGRVVARGRHAELLGSVPGYERMLNAYDKPDEEPNELAGADREGVA